MTPDEYQQHDALGLAELVARKEVRAGELLELAIARAQTVQPRLNAVVVFLLERARQDARLLDARIDTGVDGLPPLAGVPFLVKDLFQDVAGVPSSGGSRAMLKVPVSQHGDVVKRWMDAGLIIFGKTNTPEFGAKTVTESRLWGPARNPWDPSRTPGGSSGGSAAAVACGVVPVAGANDGGGSIRIPAAACGLFGLKPGRGRVSAGPAVAEGLAGTAVQGVVSRSVRDTAAMMDVLQGPEAHAPYYMPPPPTPYLRAHQQPPGRLRIGFSTDSPIGTPVDPEAVSAVHDAARLLESLGHRVEPAAPEIDGMAMARDFITMWCSHLHLLCHRLRTGAKARRADIEFDTRLLAAIGRTISARGYLEAEDRLNNYIHDLSAFHARYDLWLSPTLSAPAPAIGSMDTPPLWRWLGDIAIDIGLAGILPRTPVFQTMVAQNLSWAPFCQLANLTGRPAMSVPLYWTPSGLPLGVQFTAGLNAEMLLLRLAAQLEQARPWFDRRAQI